MDSVRAYILTLPLIIILTLPAHCIFYQTQLTAIIEACKKNSVKSSVKFSVILDLQSIGDGDALSASQHIPLAKELSSEFLDMLIFLKFYFANKTSK